MSSPAPGVTPRVTGVATKYPVSVPAALVCLTLARELAGWWIGYQDVPWVYKLGLTLPE